MLSKILTKWGYNSFDRVENIMGKEDIARCELRLKSLEKKSFEVILLSDPNLNGYCKCFQFLTNLIFLRVGKMLLCYKEIFCLKCLLYFLPAKGVNITIVELQQSIMSQKVLYNSIKACKLYSN